MQKHQYSKVKIADNNITKFKMMVFKLTII